MNPDVVTAIDELTAQGVLDPGVAAPLRRAASGSLVSVREELRVLLWAGVLLITTGAGILITAHLDRIGPLAIAIALGLAAAACLGWAFTRVSTAGFVFDTVLLLGALLAAAELAFVEVKFTPLGSHWPWHLLIVAAGYAALAFRFDSASLFSLALTSFAAWRGVSIAGVANPWGPQGFEDGDRLLIEALICGVLFLAIGKLLESLHIEPQFEPAAAWLGWILILGSLAMRLWIPGGRIAVALALMGCGALLSWFAWEEHRLGRYAMGVGAAAVGLGGLAFVALDYIAAGDTSYFGTVVMLAAGVIVLVLRAHRALWAAP